MSAVTVRLAGALRPHAGDRAVVHVTVGDGGTVRDALDALAEAYPAVGRRVRDEQGALRRHVNVYVGEEEVRGRRGQDTPLGPGDELYVLASVSGG